jgi:hypothetical protein
MDGSPGIVIAHTYTNGSSSANSITVNLSPAPAAGDLEVAFVYGYNTSDQCYTLTVPSGWTEYDSTCVGSNRHTVWTLSHVAGASDTLYTFNISNPDYLAVVVYDLSGASGIASSQHKDLSFVSGTGTQTTASLSSTADYSLAIAAWADENYADPAVGSPYTRDVNQDISLHLTTAHYALDTPQATSATATYASGYPADGGETSLLIVSPAVNLARPILPEVAEACTGITCIPGTGTKELVWGVEMGPGDYTADCPGWSSTSNCQGFNNVIINDCNTANPSIPWYAQDNSHETDFTHTDSSGSLRYTYGGESTDCANFPKFPQPSTTAIPLLNYAAAQMKTDVPAVVTSKYIAAGNGIFSDDHNFDSDAPLTSYEICDGCGHTWIAGGSYNVSFEQNYADEVNELPYGKVWLNSLNSAAGATGGACATPAPLPTGWAECYGDKYNAGTYDNRVKLDEFCSALTGNNFTAIRQEHALMGSNSTEGGPYFGIGLTVLLDSVYQMRTDTHCTNSVLIVEESYPADRGNGWMEPVFAALQAMAPSSDGTPDEIVQEPYSYCFEHGCTNDTSIWPEMFIVPYGPTFTVSPYVWAGTSAHSATFCGPGGVKGSQQGDHGGVENLVLSCVAQDQPVLHATYQHCYFLDKDLGACEWVLNAADGNATISQTGLGYNYEVNFTGCEFGNASSMGGGKPISTMFPWITDSNLINALTAAQSANTNTACNGGDIGFASLPSSITMPANTAVLLVASKPANY